MAYKQTDNVYVLESYRGDVKHAGTHIPLHDVVDATKYAVEQLFGFTVKLVKKNKKADTETYEVKYKAIGKRKVLTEKIEVACEFSAYNRVLEMAGNYRVRRLTNSELAGGY